MTFFLTTTSRRASPIEIFFLDSFPDPCVWQKVLTYGCKSYNKVHGLLLVAWGQMPSPLSKNRVSPLFGVISIRKTGIKRSIGKNRLFSLPSYPNICPCATLLNRCEIGHIIKLWPTFLTRLAYLRRFFDFFLNHHK